MYKLLLALIVLSLVMAGPSSAQFGGLGDKVKKGEKLFTVYCHDRGKLDYVKYAWKKLMPVVVK